MTTIGIIGAGNQGSGIARRAIQIGLTVVMANSRGPESLTGVIADLGEHASAATVEEASMAGDIVFVSVPIVPAYALLPAEALAGRIVVDTGNYYPEWYGRIVALDNGATTTAEILQVALPDSFVVKAFNSIGAVALADEAQPTGSHNRRALPLAGDDDDARQRVAELIDAFGFDPVDVGPLTQGFRFDRAQPAYGVRLTTPQLKEALAAAEHPSPTEF